MHLFLVCDILFNSRIYQGLENPLAQPILLGTAASVLLGYLVFSLLKKYFLVVGLALFILGLVLHQMDVFANVARTDSQIGALFQFIWAMSFLVFYALIRAGQMDRLVRALVAYASVYVVVYVFMALANSAGLLPGSLTTPITLSDNERGDRLFNYAAATAFAWFTWLIRVKRAPKLKNMVMLGMCGLAIVLSVSRVYILFLVIVTALYLSRLHYKSIGRICGVAFVFAVGQNMLGLLHEDWNPYQFFHGDSSGDYRVMEYGLARDYILQSPISGFGIAPSPAIAGTVLNHDFFAAGDLGPTGVWFDWGLIGLTLFFAGSYVAFCSRVAALINGPPLFLTGCLLGLEGCLSPLIVTGGATMFSLLLAFWLVRRQGSGGLRRGERPVRARQGRTEPCVRS